jgi:hypothetical protein
MVVIAFISKGTTQGRGPTSNALLGEYGHALAETLGPTHFASPREKQKLIG